MRYLRTVAAGCLLAAVSAAAVVGATRTWTMTPEVAAPGDQVTDAIHDWGGGGAAFRGTELYLIAWRWLDDGRPCSVMPGAIKVAVIAWTDNGLSHEGLAQFTMPVVPDGRYWLGERIDGVIPPCATAGFITVSASRNPNTALAQPQPGSGTLLTMAGLIVLIAAVGVARVSLRRSPTDR